MAVILMAIRQMVGCVVLKCISEKTIESAKECKYTSYRNAHSGARQRTIYVIALYLLARLPLSCWWLILPIQNDVKNLKNY